MHAEFGRQSMSQCVSVSWGGVCLSRRTAVSVRHKPPCARMQLPRVAWALTGAAICCFLILLIHSRLLKEGNHSQLRLVTRHFFFFSFFLHCSNAPRQAVVPMKFSAAFNPMRSVHVAIKISTLFFFFFFILSFFYSPWDPIRNRRVCVCVCVCVCVRSTGGDPEQPHPQFSLSTSHWEDGRLINILPNGRNKLKLCRREGGRKESGIKSSSACAEYWSVVNVLNRWH